MIYRPLKLFPILTVLPTLVICAGHIHSTTEPSLSVIALPIILLTTVPFRMLIYRYDFHVAQQVFWIPHAIVYATLVHLARTVQTYKWYYTLDWTYSLPPKWLIAFYFPATCFRMAFKMDLHILRRSHFQIFFLTVIGGLLNATLLGILMKYTLSTNWTVLMGLLFGAICTINEGAHRIQVANEMDKYKHLITVMEGESLIGTATGIIIMELALEMTIDILNTWYAVFIFLLREIGVGLAFGLVIGYIGRFMILRLHNDRMGLLGVSFVCTYLAYYVTTIAGGNGALACVLACLKIAAERARYGNDIDHLLFTFWENMYSLGKPYFFVVILGICFERVYFIGIHNYSELTNISVLYFMSTVTRIIGFLFVSPILSRTGYGIDFKSILFIMWAPQKSLVSLLCGLSIFHDVQLQSMAVECIGGVTILFVLTLLINSNTVPLLLKLFNFRELSTMKRTNMINCMKYIMDKRKQAISLLKMNRFLSDANWPLVLDITLLKHPYKVNSTNEADEQGEEELFGDSRASYCAECDKVVQIDPTPKEYTEMTKEARLRVLKSEKISYIRQYEKGLLSQEGIRSLLQAVEVALDSSDLIIKLDDYFRVIKKRNIYDIIKKCLMRLTRKVAQTQLKPNMTFRRKCYIIAHHNYFNFLCFLVISMHIILEVLYFALKKTWKPHKHMVVQLVNYLAILFEVFYASRIFIRIMALSYSNLSLGLKLYFTDFINILDFGGFITKTCCVIAMNTIYLNRGISVSWGVVHNVYYYIVCLKTLQNLGIILNLVPKIIRLCDRNYDSRIAYAYEIGNCLVNGYNEVAEMLVQMIRNKKIRDIIHKQLDADRLAITRELGLMHKFSPWIAVSTKTRQAIKATLNHLNQTVEELRTSGFVDEYEHSKLRESIEDRMRVLRNLKTVELSSPKALFKELQWLQNEQTAEYLYENSSTRVWDAGKVICKKGEPSDGVFVLVTGLFKLVYEPDANFIQLQQETGYLPIVDYLSSTKFSESMQDYIFAGNSIGELCVLTQRPYNCTIVAEVPSQAFVLNQRLLLHTIHQDVDPVNGLASRLWKYVAVNIGVAILLETAEYQTQSADQIRLLLENAFLPNLIAFNVLVLNNLVVDVILVDGTVQDLSNAERYVAPCYIPRTIEKLVINKKENNSGCAILIIIPDKDTDKYELMDMFEDESALDSDASESALVNPNRLREKNAIPMFNRARANIHKLSSGSSNVFRDQDRQRSRHLLKLGQQESKEYGLKMPLTALSVADVCYKNKEISTFALGRYDEGYSRAKIASNSGLNTDAELFTMDPTLRGNKLSKSRMQTSYIKPHSNLTIEASSIFKLISANSNINPRHNRKKKKKHNADAESNSD